MSLFVMFGFDRDGSSALRQATRPAHLEWIDGLGDRVKLAGPILTDEGAPMGSMIIVEAASLIDARALFDGDPYARAGLWERQAVHPYVQVRPAGAP